MAKNKVRNESTLQVCLPVEAYEAIEQLAEYEGSTMSQVGRRAIIGLLAQVGMYQPPHLRQRASQQQAAAVKA